MADCCAHSKDEHEIATICEAMIHYPSEDYPCLCEGFVAEGPSGACTCGHAAGKHLVTRTCKPRSAVACDCRLQRRLGG